MPSRPVSPGVRDDTVQHEWTSLIDAGLAGSVRSTRETFEYCFRDITRLAVVDLARAGRKLLTRHDPSGNRVRVVDPRSPVAAMVGDFGGRTDLITSTYDADGEGTVTWGSIPVEQSHRPQHGPQDHRVSAFLRVRSISTDPLSTTSELERADVSKTSIF